MSKNLVQETISECKDPTTPRARKTFPKCFNPCKKTPAFDDTNLPDVLKVCNAVVEKNTENMVKCVRSSLTTALFDFLDVTKPTQQVEMLQTQLNSQREIQEVMITNMRLKMRQLEANQLKLQKKTDEQANSMKMMEGKYLKQVSLNMQLKQFNEKLQAEVFDLTLDKQALTNQIQNADFKLEAAEAIARNWKGGENRRYDHL